MLNLVYKNQVYKNPEKYSSILVNKQNNPKELTPNPSNQTEMRIYIDMRHVNPTLEAGRPVTQNVETHV